MFSQSDHTVRIANTLRGTSESLITFAYIPMALLNTNYPTGFNATYIYNTDDTPRPGGWGTPTSIYTPRFVRLNFTLNF